MGRSQHFKKETTGCMSLFEETEEYKKKMKNKTIKNN